MARHSRAYWALNFVFKLQIFDSFWALHGHSWLNELWILLLYSIFTSFRIIFLILFTISQVSHRSYTLSKRRPFYYFRARNIGFVWYISEFYSYKISIEYAICQNYKNKKGFRQLINKSLFINGAFKSCKCTGLTYFRIMFWKVIGIVIWDKRWRCDQNR